MLDHSKLPSSLFVHRVWAPVDEGDDRRPIAYVGDRRRRGAGFALIALGGLVGLLAGLAFWFGFAGLLIALAGVAFGSGGRSGFYEVAEDGGLGEYLGRAQPDLAEMHTRC